MEKRIEEERGGVCKYVCKEIGYFFSVVYHKGKRKEGEKRGVYKNKEMGYKSISCQPFELEFLNFLVYNSND